MTPEITTKALLAWLNAQRDAANEKIVAASPQEEGQYKQELQIINAIAERVGEMTAVEYLEVCNEICEGRESCDGCGLFEYCPFCMAQEFPRRAVEIVRRWKEEHHD